MHPSIFLLKHDQLDSFLGVFEHILSTEFPGYSKNVVRYFLDKIYTKHNFSWWLTQGQTILVAQDNETIVGFAVIDAPYGGVSLCRWLGVLKSFQKKGKGTQLVQAWIKNAVSQGCHKVEVAGQPEAKGFYEKMGLALEGKRTLSYFGIDQYIFGKVIGIPHEAVMTS